VSPQRVYAAWTDKATKARWFIGPSDQWTPTAHTLEARVGGEERLEGIFGADLQTAYVARYHVIEPDTRLVYVYDMHVDKTLMSVSLATVDFAPTATGGTTMTYTEQVVFVDGEDGTASRKEGAAAQFDLLAAVLA
jgi:uncharacterized protein YndB with AHSA1/START domain